jgi:hypothetical protein
MQLRMAKEAPSSKKSKTDTDAPQRANPNTENDEPKVPKLLRAKVLPR